jgi:hypothetical protein
MHPEEVVTMHQHQPLPDRNALPSLSDEAAAQILQFLYHCAALFEARYDTQLRHYYQDPTPPDQLDLFPDTDPPF